MKFFLFVVVIAIALFGMTWAAPKVPDVKPPDMRCTEGNYIHLVQNCAKGQRSNEDCEYEWKCLPV